MAAKLASIPVPLAPGAGLPGAWLCSGITTSLAPPSTPSESLPQGASHCYSAGTRDLPPPHSAPKASMSTPSVRVVGDPMNRNLRVADASLTSISDQSALTPSPRRIGRRRSRVGRRIWAVIKIEKLNSPAAPIRCVLKHRTGIPWATGQIARALLRCRPISVPEREVRIDFSRTMLVLPRNNSVHVRTRSLLSRRRTSIPVRPS